MGSTAHVRVLFVVVKADSRTFRDITDDLLLIRLITLFKRCHRLVAADVLTNNIVLMIDERLHALFNGFHIVWRD